MKYDCIIVGGGIAGLQAAIQLGRYRRKVAVIDMDFGRSTLCRNYHNILGWPGGISGPELRRLGRQQAEAFGVEFISDEIKAVTANHPRADRDDGGFRLTGASERIYETGRLLFATGIVDNIPDIQGINACLGNSVYVCPDCDGYEIIGHRTVIMGAGEVGAKMALTLSYFERNLIFVDHAPSPLKADLSRQLEDADIEYTKGTVTRVAAETESAAALSSVTLSDGRVLTAERGFVAFGGNRVNSQLTSQMGAETLDNGHIRVDARTKMTNIEHVYAAGDVVAHSEQTTIAMGDGAQAAIWIHKSLFKNTSTS